MGKKIRREVNKDGLQALIGVGGVGTGSFFALDGNQTLGREESRGGHFLDRKDYCKLHIIAHYVKVLAGTEFPVFPISLVGDDEPGHRLLTEMQEIGLDTRYLSISPGEPTLFSFCFVYPDGSGGNLSTSNAANEKVDTSLVESLSVEFAKWRNHGIALAVPEVPLAARQRLLELGTEYGFFRVVSLTDEEARSEHVEQLLIHADLLALNLGEAAALARCPAEALTPEEIIRAVLDRLKHLHPGVWLSITGGKQGSWCWDGTRLTHTPALPVQAVNTAGAGDAHLAGILAGLIAGWDLPRSHQLAALVAGMKVTHPDTLHKGITRKTLKEFAWRENIQLDPAIQKYLAFDS
jgi:ribokinase